MELFPSILIGGPPHMGKSVLAYSLTRALRQRGIEHYVLRAYPDGEGDWANESDQALVRRIRIKGQGTPDWVTNICRDIATRHLPLIVDVGGKPTNDQERVFDYCTHAILLTGDKASHDAWQTMAQRHGLILLADLHSRLTGTSRVTDSTPVLRGVITGLERGTIATGPVFDALVEQISHIFAYDPEELRHAHIISAPVETVIDLDRLARTLDVPRRKEQAVWEPRHLPTVLAYLPEATPLGLYGRGPNWLYVALVLLAAPASFVQFDVRLGWVSATPLHVDTPDPAAPLQIRSHAFADYVHIEGVLPTAYLDYSQLETLAVPSVPAGSGVVLSGKIPHWLYTSLALTYRSAPWIAVYQPQLKCAIVVHSTDKFHIIGDCIRHVQFQL